MQCLWMGTVCVVSVDGDSVCKQYLALVSSMVEDCRTILGGGGRALLGLLPGAL